jgi:hypothetical protein
MTRNTSRFVSLYHLIRSCISPKRQASQTAYLYSRVSMIWASKYSTLHTNAHKMVNLMVPMSDRKWCGITHVHPINASYRSMHPCGATTYTISHFMSIRESFYLWYSAPIVVIHRFMFFCYWWRHVAIHTKTFQLHSETLLYLETIKNKCS